MTLGRREFVQRLGAAMAALGIGDLALAGPSSLYQQALARSSRRLALLVGINQYSEAARPSGNAAGKIPPLQGATMDVELQRELLVHRFGAAPSDILTLIDQQATTPAILEAVQTHLVEQAQPGDVVIVHFSGLGGQAQLTETETETDEAPPLPTLVTASSRWPTPEQSALQDLFQETLAEALTQLQGVRVVTILDTSSVPYADPLLGNFRVRSRSHLPKGIWQPPRDHPWTRPSKTAAELSTTWPGLLLCASHPNRPALEGSWYHFSAGLFTYALTQQIWSSFPAQGQTWIFHRVERTMETWTGTDASPQLQGSLSTHRRENLLFPSSIPKPAAAGVIKTIDTVNKTAILWLGGLPDILLPYTGLGLRLRPLPTVPGATAPPQGTVVVKATEGLRAKATLQGSSGLIVGTPLVEIERFLPREVTLTVVLDPALERIERVDATSALSGLPFITTTAPGEHPADCLFGRLRPSSDNPPPVAQSSDTNSQAAESAAAESGAPQLRYGLFSADHTLIPGTATEAEEAVKTAVSRLSEPLRNLLAIKILRLTANPVSSQLPLRLTLETLDQANKLLLVEETLASRQFSGLNSTREERILLDPSTPSRSQKYRLKLQHLGQTPLYYLVVNVVEKNRFSVYCPPFEQAEGIEQTTKMIAEASLLSPNAAIQIPKQADGSFSLQELRATELFALVCTRPFYATWKAIRTADFRQASDRWATVPNPLAIAKAVLRDLNQASVAVRSPDEATSEPSVLLRSDVWGTLSLRPPI